ncbi:MAG: hypothetical protein FJ222_11330 [Lentisphaerae bacterium]|nr:hypothetical protein [Lentisphaerota bacterium]
MMKERLATLLLLGAFCAVTVGAKGSSWHSQLGGLVQDPQGVRAVMAGLSGEEAQAFATQLLRAANTVPLSAVDKNQRMARIAHELVAGSQGVTGKQDVLVTIFTQANPAYLSGIADVLSVGLEMSRNNVSQEEFLRIATNVITRVHEANIGDRDALIRVTMTIATFLRAAGTGVEFEPIFLACLSDADLAGVVKNVLGPAVKGNYDLMIQANEADRSGPGNWFVSPVQAPGYPLLPPWGTQMGWLGTDGGFGLGIGGTGLGGAGAIPPPPPLPYNGQVIDCPRCNPPQEK